MQEKKIRHLPVVQDGNLLGILGIREVLRTLVERLWSNHDADARETARDRCAAAPSTATDKKKPGRAFRLRNGLPREYLRRRLGSGGTASPGRESLALLPSGPDAVRMLPVRGT